MKGYNYKTKGTMFELFLLLYVDDGSFMFELRSDMKKGTHPEQSPPKMTNQRCSLIIQIKDM
jgi:hypothetical protein